MKRNKFLRETQEAVGTRGRCWLTDWVKEA